VRLSTENWPHLENGESTVNVTINHQ